MLFEIKNKVSNKYFEDSSTKDNYSKKSLKKVPLFSKDDARIITSGKVYRQLFEAEVQLINALQKVKFTLTEFEDCDNNFSVLSKSRNFYFPSLGLFSEKCSDYSINKDVLVLPDNLVPSKTQSELIVRMIESRKLKFNKQFEDLQQSIGKINKDVNGEVSFRCEEICKDIATNRNNIESCFTILFPKSMQELSWDQYRNAGVKNYEHFTIQSVLIENLYNTLLKIEDDRVRTVMQKMSYYSTKLERTGHLAPSNVHRMMNNIIIDTNDSILRNKEMYSDLRTKLMLSTIEDHRKQQLFMKNQMLVWRKTISDFYFNEFKNLVENEESKSIDTIKELLTDFDSDILGLSSEIKDVFDSIMYHFSPEQYDSNYLNQTNLRLINIISQFDSHSETFVNVARSSIEKISSKYLISMNNIKSLLLKIHIFENEEESIKSVEGFCWPILGSLQKSLEKYLDSLEIIIDKSSYELKSQFRKLYNFLSLLLNLWNEHKVSLNKAEENVYQKLTVNRDSHRQQNLISENDLNLIIDKMRQESSEHSLKDCLTKCFAQLDKIKASYSQFYNQQVSLVKRFPVMAEAEVKLFDEKLTFFFLTNQQDEELQETKAEMKNEEKKYEIFISYFIPIKISNQQLACLKEKLTDRYGIFIKDWFKTVSKNTMKIVVTKNEELDSELKLRFHLHEPRYHRIEYDIHNVRAAELVIHVERVNRQCKAIDNSLENIKQEYIKLDEEQRLKQECFRNQLAADEMAYVNITNHSKLMNIKTMLEERNNQYMNNLRTSLRNFRQNIETNFQQLRQTNAEFVRSFKLFSAGGNFCPGEIDDFNKKIEKVNVKVEVIESEIMSNLEMVEKNHQDSLTLLKSAFEDKFKHHIVDINFMDTLNRSMSNVQLKIKTEVSNSNSQSQFISEKIKLLDHSLKKILSNKSDQQHFIDQSVLKSILSLFGCINDRSMYLDCIETQGFPKDKINLVEDKDGYNLKVQFVSITAISKGGRQPNEDPGIKSVKTLLRTQKENLLKINNESLNDSNISDAQRNELETVLPENQNKYDLTRSASVTSEMTTNRKGNTEKGKQVNKNQRFDKKYQAFSEDDSEECLTFIKKINLYCREILDGMLNSAKLYYRNKGVRKVTQPSIQDNFDQAIEDIIAKLKYYFKQAKDYHDECLQEFNNQLKELEEVICMFPSIVYRNVVEKMICECKNEIDAANKTHTEIYNNLSFKKKLNYNNLRPDLSQISKEAQLKNILFVQESLYNEELNQIENQFQKNMNIVFSCGKLLTGSVSNVTEQLLLLMDNLLTVDDVHNAEPKPRFEETKELVRKQVTIPVEVNENDKEIITTKKTWEFIDINDILQADPNFTNEELNTCSRCLITAKYTHCHIQCIKEREASITKFKVFYFGQLSEIETMKLKMVEETNSYKQFWDESVKTLLEMNNI